MGETELVLDGMSVDEVLRIVGGGKAKRGARSGNRRVAARSRASRDATVSASRGSARDARAAAWRRCAARTVGGDVDWREALARDGRGPRRVEAGSTRLAANTASPVTTMPSDCRSTPPAARVADPAGSDTLDAIAKEVAGCTLCPLYATATNPVPGEGNPNADLMCVGEAPGATEDETGRPFVGAAGQLLTKILAAIDLPREEVFICNVLKHRPPGNRNPPPDEVTACSPYLVRQIEIVQPKVIIALGHVRRANAA